jgi:hypothetical protein
MSRRARNLLGQRFNRLTVLERAGSHKRNALWLCVCDCGKEVIVRAANLHREVTRSCGCLRREMQRERMSTHRMSGTREYRSYYGAKARCLNPNHRDFADYGGRGIEFRLPGFEQFFADLGIRPPGYTLDRKNVNGHYELGNLRWATRKEQANNRRNNRRRRRRRADLAAIQMYAKSLAAAGSNRRSATP